MLPVLPVPIEHPKQPLRGQALQFVMHENTVLVFLVWSSKVYALSGSDCVKELHFVKVTEFALSGEGV